jgi:sigma-E factor negative regulatory protein RseB
MKDGVVDTSRINTKSSAFASGGWLSLFARASMLLVIMIFSAVSQAQTKSAVPLAYTDDSAQDWLKRMQVAAVEENYKGIFVFTRGNMSSSMSVVHRYRDGVEKERLKQLDGEMGEIIRDGERVMCIFPGNRVVEVEGNALSSNFTDSFKNFMPGQSQYELSLLGTDRMVDRTCVLLSIKAKDAHRFSYSLWLDGDTGLLLKSSLQDKNGADLERFQYTHINFPEDIEDSEFKVMTEGLVVDHQMIPPVKKDRHWHKNTMWQTKWVPAGFEQINGETHIGDNIMVYSDGLATYSIFIEKLQEKSMPEGASQVGATIAFSKKRRFGSHEYHVTVVGEIPAMTAMQIAESVEPIVTN